MANVVINESDLKTTIVATAGQFDFSFDWPILDADHIAVYEEGTKLVRGDDYDVPSGSIRVSSGGIISLKVSAYPSGATAGVSYELRQEVPNERITDFSNANFTYNSLNDELDLQVQMVQQIARDFSEITSDLALIDVSVAAAAASASSAATQASNAATSASNSASSASAASVSAAAAAAAVLEATAYSVGWQKQTVTVDVSTGQTQSYFNDFASLKVADTGGALVERIRVLRDGRIAIGVPNDHLAGTFPGIGIDLDIHRDYDADGVTARAPVMRLDHALGGSPTYRTDAWPVVSGSTLGQFVAAFDGNDVGRAGWVAPSTSIPVGTDHTNKYDARRNTAGNFDHADYIIQTRYDRSSALFTALRLDRYGNICVGTATPSHALHVYRADGNATKIGLSQNTRRDWTLGMGASSGELLLRDESAGITLSQYNTAGYVSLGGASAAEALRATYTASAVNYANVTGGTAGNRVSMFAEGADTNIGLALGSKGTGTVDILGSGGSVQSRFTSTASAVNYPQFNAGTTGNRVSIQANGSDTNVNLALSSRGSGTVDLMTSALGTLQARISHVASAVNYLELQGAAASGSPSIYAKGSDTNIDLWLRPKGSGVIRTGYDSSAATVAAAFTADKRLAIRTNDGTLLYVAASTTAW